jgi:hypothetical protein
MCGTRGVAVASVLLAALVVRPASAGNACRRGGGGGPRIRTVAYVVTECREVAGGFLVGHQKLVVRRGDCPPVTVMEASAPDPLPDPLGLCQVFGTNRVGESSPVAGVFQRIGVTPDGSGVVFELTDDFSLLPLLRIPPEQEGFFFVRADGSGLRALGPASRDPTFRLVPYPASPTGFGFWWGGGLDFSPDGGKVVFTDLVPGPGGEEATQVVVMDVASSRRTQVTRLPPSVPKDPLIPGIASPIFVDRRTVFFSSYANPEGLNPAGDLRDFSVRTNGTRLRALPVPVALPGSRVVPVFRLTGGGGTVATLYTPGTPVNSEPGFTERIQEAFLLDGRHLLQLTNFDRVDTFGLFLDANRRRAFFQASADPFGANPNANCQLFSVGTLAQGLERPVLRLVPARGVLLHLPRAVAHHPLHEVVGQLETGARPAPAVAEIAAGEEHGERHPDREQERVEPAARAEADHHRRHDQLDRRDQREEAAAEGERLHGLGLEHAPEELPHPLVADLLGLETERAVEEPAAEEAARPDREASLPPRRDEPEGHDRQEEKRPGDEPAAVEPAAERGTTDDPPREEPEEVFGRVCRPEAEQPLRKTRPGELPREARSGWQAEQPAPADAGRAEPLAEDRRARPRPAARGDLGRGEERLHLGEERRLERVAERPAHHLGIERVGAEVGCEDADRAPAARDERQEAVAAQMEERRPGAAHEAAAVAVRRVRGLGLEPHRPGGALDPAREDVRGRSVGRRRDLDGARREAASPRDGLERVAEPRRRPNDLRQLGHVASTRRPLSSRSRRHSELAQSPVRTASSASSIAR